MDSVLSRLGLIRVSQLNSSISPARVRPESNVVEWFDMCERYYENVSLYNDLVQLARLSGKSGSELHGLRNPVFRTTEFYASTVWPGPIDEALPIETENPLIVEPIQQVWTWSNWAEQKQVAVRRAAYSGSLFLKIETTDDGRPYIYCLKPQLVSGWQCDKRGFLTNIRIDTPTVVTIGTSPTVRVKTEIWDLSGVRIYENTTGATALGEPTESRTLEEFGIDFIPIVYAKFRDIGNWYGAPCWIHAIDKIDQVNRIASRGHEMAFGLRKIWALSSVSNDTTGRPLPPPMVQDSQGSPTRVSDVDDDSWLFLPSNTQVQSLVPNLDFSGINETIRDHMHEIEQDLPELVYYKLTEQSDVSGRAIRMKLGAAIGKVIEARGQLESALVRADKMALTIGQINGKFRELGSFDEGALDHSFEERDVLPADTAAILNELILKQSLGVPPRQLQVELGYTDEDQLQWQEWATAAVPTAQDAADKLLTAMTRRGEVPSDQ